MTDCEERHWHGWISIVERSHILIPLNPLPLCLFEAISSKSQIKLKIWRALTTCCAIDVCKLVRNSPYFTLPGSHLLVHQQPNATTSTALSPLWLSFSAKWCFVRITSSGWTFIHTLGVITSRQPTPNAQLQGPWRVCHTSPTQNEHVCVDVHAA